MSDSLPPLMAKEQQEPFALVHEKISLSLFCSQKTHDLLEKPMSEFSTLQEPDWVLYRIITEYCSTVGCQVPINPGSELADCSVHSVGVGLKVNKQCTVQCTLRRCWAESKYGTMYTVIKTFAAWPRHIYSYRQQVKVLSIPRQENSQKFTKYGI